MKFITVLLSILLLYSCSNIKEQGDKSVAVVRQMYDLVHNPNANQTEISGLQLVLIKNGKITFEHAEGIATIADNGETKPLTIDHKVRVASISKFVLTLAFMSLVEDGSVNLDEDISHYLGYWVRNPNFPDIIITSRQLLAHVSSVRDAGRYFLALGEGFEDFFKPSKYYVGGKHFAESVGQEPGKYFTYSNLNFGIIAGIIENVSGQRFDLFVKEKLFKPLDLDVSFNTCDLAKNNFQSLATLFRRGDGGDTWDVNGPWKQQVDGNSISCYYGGPSYSRTEQPQTSKLNSYKIGSNPTLFSPQGGLRASAKDLATIMQLVISLYSSNNDNSAQNIISKSSIDKMLFAEWQYSPNSRNGNILGEDKPADYKLTGLMTAYGLSTHIIDLKDWGLASTSKKYYGHLGSAYGLQGQFWFDPLTGDGFVALITGMGSDPEIPESATPMFAIEETVLRLALSGLNSI